jgi:hypothetical protein
MNHEFRRMWKEVTVPYFKMGTRGSFPAGKAAGA